MKTPKILIAALILTLTACGQAPSIPSIDGLTTDQPTLAANPVSPAPASTPDPTPSSSPSPLPPPTIVSYIFQNSIGICDAVKNWNPATTTIVFPGNSGGGYIYTFAATGIRISDPDGGNAGNFTGTITKAGAFNNPPVCTITVNMGTLASVQ